MGLLARRSEKWTVLKAEIVGKFKAKSVLISTLTAVSLSAGMPYHTHALSFGPSIHTHNTSRAMSHKAVLSVDKESEESESEQQSTTEVLLPPPSPLSIDQLGSGSVAIQESLPHSFSGRRRVQGRRISSQLRLEVSNAGFVKDPLFLTPSISWLWSRGEGSGSLGSQWTDTTLPDSCSTQISIALGVRFGQGGSTELTLSRSGVSGNQLEGTNK